MSVMEATSVDIVIKVALDNFVGSSVDIFIH